MATSPELAERLLKRFKGVPNFDITDAQELVDDAVQVHGLDPSATIPVDKVNLILLYAQAQGALQIALSTAHYFSFQDGEESIDKSSVSDRYRNLANDLRSEYERERNAQAGSRFRAMRRLDR